MSDYRALIELTSEVLLKRTNCFRILVIVVILTILTLLITAILVVGVWPTVGLLLLTPIYSLFLVCDSHLLIGWRTRILEAWKSQAIDLSALRQALTANQALPQQTIDAMLEMLPDAGDLAEEQSVSHNIRLAATDILTAHSHTQHYKLIRNALIHAVIALPFSWAVFTESWTVVSLLAAVPVLFIAFGLLNRLRKSKIVERENRYRTSDDFNDAQYSQIINSQASSLDGV